MTSSLVKISSPFELPESDSKTVAPQSAAVAIDRDGQFMVNNKKVSSTGLSRALRKELKSLSVSEQPTITIVAEKDVPFRYVKTAMEAAARLNAQAIIATQPKTN